MIPRSLISLDQPRYQFNKFDGHQQNDNVLKKFKYKKNCSAKCYIYGFSKLPIKSHNDTIHKQKAKN